MRMMPIASGSGGNCIYIGSDNTHIIIDAGVSRKRIEEGLNCAGISLKDISAILVTHEHSDHIKSLGVISRKDNIPMYATKGTFDGMCSCSLLGSFSHDNVNIISADKEFLIGDLKIKPFTISHDANEPVAYSVINNNKKATVLTDLGVYTDYTIGNLKNSDIMLVESNHDENLLEVGSYPYSLKQRILSNKGHLSNVSCGKLIDTVLHDRVERIYLGHISKENNYDRLAFETVKLEIDSSESRFKAGDFQIETAKPDCISGICEVS
ncbi:MAG: MBL fold metallo-hydrolase [Lachnospira sp.]